MDEEEQQQPEDEITPQKMARLKNLKAFHGWTEDAIREYMKDRPKKVPKLFSDNDGGDEETLEYDDTEYKKKYRSYHQRYIKEYGVDMNDANDAQALESLVRLVIQSEIADENIRKIQNSRNVDSRTLKNMGDFQRSIQMSITDLQDRLGISRKTRKDKNVDDIPQYIRSLQVKAKDFWERSTKPVRCSKCNIELARYWLNFPKNARVIHFEVLCSKCEEEVVYSA